MQYKRFVRPKLSRNKYGFVNNSTQVGGGFSSYSSDGSSFNGDVSYLLDELQDFTGATQFENGLRGLVPAPLAGMQDYYFLKADGNWTYVPAYKWLHEWPDIGDPRGLELDGDFNVTGTINTMDLNVQGTAHFWELVIDRVKANGGQVIVSPSLFEVDWVGGTQIYEFGFDCCPFAVPRRVLGDTNLWANYQTDFTQWTNTNGIVQFLDIAIPWNPKGRPFPTGRYKNYNLEDIVYFWNTTETNINKEKFTQFCRENHLYQGGRTSAQYGEVYNFPQWGEHITGYFDRDMRDENGELLPLKDGFPYDWDAHWMDYYNLSVDSSDNNKYGAGHISVSVDYTYTFESGYVEQRTQEWRGLCMSSIMKMKYQNISSKWAEIVAARPDIWYRFFSKKLEKVTIYPVYSDEIEKLPIDAEYELGPGTSTVSWIIPSWDNENKYYKYATYGGTPDEHWFISKEGSRYIQYMTKRLYMRCDDGTRRTFNECEVGDMLRCRSFNIKEGVYHNVSNKDFWTFVVGKGEQPYTDDDGVEHEAFYVDLVYALKVIDGPSDTYKYYPIGTLFRNVDTEGEGNPNDIYVDPLDTSHDVDSNIDLPQGWEQNMVSILNLKKISKDTLCGLRDVIDEFPTDEEFEQAVDLISEIRGQDLFINFLNGTTQTIGDTQTEEEANPEPDIVYTQDGYIGGKISKFQQMKKENEGIDFTMNGTLPTNPGDLTGLILGEKFTSIDDTKFTDDELDDANFLGYAILKGGRDGDDIAEANEDGDAPDGYSNEVTETNDTGRKLKYRENKHNYSSKEYYSQYKFGYGKWNVRTGDQFACLGNLYDQSRMNAIVISSVTPIDPELIPPSIAQYHLIDIFGESISRFRYTTIAKNGNNFFGQFNIDSGEGSYFQIDDKINLFIKDIYNNLELVGIHLDGENSVIKMIGNIELHQHSEDDYDTFSVWDSHERKRVEILPKEIPTREDQDSILAAVNNKLLEPVNTTWVAPKNYIYYNEYKTGGIIWHLIGGDKVADYILNAPYGSDKHKTPYCFTVNTITNLGTFGRDNNEQKITIDISNLSVKCDTTNTYLLYGGNTERILERYFPDIEIYGMTPIKNIQNLKIYLRVGSPNGNVVKTYTEQLPVYTSTQNGAIFNFNIYTSFIQNAELNFAGLNSQNYYLDVSFDVYPLCAAKELSRATTYSFNGTAQTTGQFSVTSNRQNAQGEHVDTSISQMMIGTNGMVFNQDNSRFFYAGEDGVEIRWDDSRLTLDDTNGLCIAPGVFAGGTPSRQDSVIFSNNQDILLPDASTYGEGRRLTVIGTTQCVRGSVIRVGFYSNALGSLSRFSLDVGALQLDTTWSATVEYGQNVLHCCWIGGLEFISYNGIWYVCSGLTTSLVSL